MIRTATRTVIRTLALTCVGLLALPVMAADLVLPAGARQLSDRTSPLARYALPLGPSIGDQVPTAEVEGRVMRRTWRLLGEATSLQLLAPLRQQVLDAGYDIRFQCQSQGCGGFDFRFGIEVVPAPDMGVDIGDYLFLSASKDTGQALSLLVSRSGKAAYFQVIEVAPVEMAPVNVPVAANEPSVASAPVEDTPVAGVNLVTTLMAEGRVVLADLEFVSGSARLGEGPFDSLLHLATVLAKSPQFRVTLVGHTDNIGNQDSNVDLSRRRAAAVRRRMIERFADLDGARIAVAGAGFMAPLASNLTPEGREANRRVEAVLMAVQ